MKIKLLFLSILFIIVSLFFKDLFIKGNIPIPSDTIVGLYYPFRDFYAKEYPRGMPYKNFLITDPVRQQYPWKKLTIDVEKTFQLPLWNPYNFSGTPHLANFQSAALSPFNLLFFFLPFSLSWSLIIFIQPLIAAFTMFLFLDNLKLNRKASLFGAVVFSFCGFSISWMQWGNILATSAWLPLIFLSIDKLFKEDLSKFKWMIVLLLSLSFAFFAGHLQIFFYLFVTAIIYLVFRWLDNGRKLKSLLLPILAIIGFVVVSAVQWIPTLQFIALSARSSDLPSWTDKGWFIPFQNLVQFIAPDFFGNPATLNYYGIWNYGEFIGYIGVISLIFVFFAILYKREKHVYFFVSLLLVSLLFSLPNFISAFPFKLSIPFLSTSQPTRLIFIIDVCLSILSAFGLDLFHKEKKHKKILITLFVFLLLFAGLWVFVIVQGFNLTTLENIAVAKRNLVFPTILFLISILLIMFYSFREKLKLGNKIIESLPFIFIIFLTFDLFRFGWKFLPFTDVKYLFPNTKVISFIQKNIGNFRVMEQDSRILPPNFSIVYKIQSVDGYDPLYLQTYGELMAAIGRDNPNISSPFGFNRIINSNSYNSPFFDLMGVRYVLSLIDIDAVGFKKVFQEGETRVYINEEVFDRTFFVQKIINVDHNQKAIDLLFENRLLLKNIAVISNFDKNISDKDLSIGTSKIDKYSENRVEISTSNIGDGFLILTDSFYPTWKVKIDGIETKIYRTDYNFRGILVPKGEHKIVFYDNLF